MTLQVKLVVPEGEVWTGDADRIVAKTLDGDVGILTGHTPVLGILSPGSVVRILPEGAAAGAWVQAAVGSGFLSVAANRVSVLAREAVLGGDVDKAAVRSELENPSTAEAGSESDTARANFLKAQLRAAGEEV